VGRTGDIGLIRVVDEGAVAAGVRRLEAVTGDRARRQLVLDSRRLHDLAGLLKAPAADAVPRLESLIEERRKLERDLAEARKALAMGTGAPAGGAARDIGGIKLIARTLNGIAMKDLKSLADEGKAQIGSGIVAFVAIGEDGKAGLVVGVTGDLTNRFSAVDLVRIGSERLGGKGGGGRPDMAQAGGRTVPKPNDALAAIEAAIARA
jgi:alanyl-tRNA synthetase